MFERFLFTKKHTCKKTSEEANLWLNAHNLDSRNRRGNWTKITQYEESRRPHDNDRELKCSIRMRWVKKTQVAGAAWVLSNKREEAMLHSRRSFGAVGSKDEAYFLSLA